MIFGFILATRLANYYLCLLIIIIMRLFIELYFILYQT